MMKQVLKIELRRAFTSRGMFLALLIGSALAVYHCITEVLPMAETVAYHTSPEMLAIQKGPFYPDFLYFTWLGGTMFRTLPTTLYFMILPILAALPFADSLFTDMKDGYIKNVCLRVEKKEYYLAKYIAVFLSGGVAAVAPLLLSFLLACMFLPAMKPEPNAGNLCAIRETSSFPWLYYNLPMVFIALYLVINFVFSGLLACLGVVATAYLGYRFLVLVTPFIVYLFINSGFGLLGLKDWQPNNFLLSGYENDVRLPILVCTLVLLAVSVYGYLSTRKSDVY